MVRQSNRRDPSRDFQSTENGNAELEIFSLDQVVLEPLDFASNMDQIIDQLYGYWILGGGAEPRQPRWSVIRNVLG